ncbi:hypothetical protein C1631_021375 [Chryseobacterium phosphatilyticum]|uniref:Uncharacterized protein n=1 Tax=Chryseobacterium phosphatilyticum TaxID=475075 RepID=A0A316WQS6_9FLAO|nr:hypothetical protein [Chryseobacterium phosphatilyticum]PWN63537.1 hypothetical protein C1631_021375 [Chryseobacterium phosphatilyticum]
MELKQLNKLLILLALAISIKVFSQMRMADIENKEFSINLKTEKGNIIKIFEDKNYDVYYILDRKRFDFDKKLRSIDPVNLIFFSKKYNKGILTLFKQSIEQKKKSVYNIRLYTGAHDNYMFIPSMIIVGKDLNYEYLMKYSYVPLPPPSNNVFTSIIKIQDCKNYCNVLDVDVKGNIIFESIDDILNNVSKVNKNSNVKACDPIIIAMDFKEFFPEKIIK